MPPANILQRPGRLEQLWPLSVEAYHALGEAGLIPEKTELLHGLVFKKTPKSPLHRALAQRLANLFRKLIGNGFVVWTEQPIVCVDSEPEPDVAVIKGSEEDFWDKHPDRAELIVEVAVTSEDIDRDKSAAYAAAGIPEYWIVLPGTRTVEVYRKPVDGTYASKIIVDASGTLVLDGLPGVAISVKELFEK